MKSSVVIEGDWIILKSKGELNRFFYKLIQIKSKSSINLGRKLGYVSSDLFLGLPLNAYYEVNRETSVGTATNIIVKSPSFDEIEIALQTELAAIGSGKDNCEICDDNTAQTLTSQDMEVLKENSSSHQIIEALVGGSSSFEKKTEFSQAKYIKKKMDKYAKTFKLLPANFINIYWNFWCKSPSKIQHIRLDTISQLIHLANVQNEMNILAVDDTHGLISLGCLERMTSGVVCIVESSFPDILQYDRSNLPKYTSISLKRLTSKDDVVDDESFCQQTAAEQSKSILIKKAKDLFSNASFDALIISAESFDTFSLFKLLQKAIKLSRNVVIYSQFKEKLLDTYGAMMRDDRWINVLLTESFLREYQVLPGRMHPTMKTNGISGYLLSAIKISS